MKALFVAALITTVTFLALRKYCPLSTDLPVGLEKADASYNPLPQGMTKTSW